MTSDLVFSDLIDGFKICGTKELIDAIENMFVVCRLKNTEYIDGLLISNGLVKKPKKNVTYISKKNKSDKLNQAYYWFSSEKMGDLRVCFFRDDNHTVNSLYVDYDSCHDKFKEQIYSELICGNIFRFTHQNTLYSKNHESMIKILNFCMKYF